MRFHNLSPFLIAGCQGYRWSCLQALKDSRGAQVHRQGLHRHAPEAEGELEKVLQGQEVHPIGPKAQEDPRHLKGFDPT